MRARSMIMGLVALGTAFTFMPAKAQAYDEYCREYTRTVYIGNRQEVAYGTACYQPNGDWKIVDEDDRSRIGQRFRNEDVSSNYTPDYQPVYQPASRTYYYRTVPQRTQFVFVAGNSGRHKGHYNNHRHDRYDRYDRHDRDDHRRRH